MCTYVDVGMGARPTRLCPLIGLDSRLDSVSSSTQLLAVHTLYNSAKTMLKSSTEIKFCELSHTCSIRCS